VVFREHADQDDREIQKLHQAAIQGDLRKKKRNHGVGLDDSDDDSDDEEKNRRIRRGMNKKPKIDRDNIRDLGQCYLTLGHKFF
jgi:mediator of replication checkpoint protein 1